MWELHENSMRSSGADKQIIDGKRYLAKGVCHCGIGQSWIGHNSECPPISESD